MIKGILLCFAFLFAQLIALHHIDTRLNGGTSEARQVASPPPPTQRKEDEAERSDPA